MEIVLLLGFADVIFWRERSDDWKYICAFSRRLGLKELLQLSLIQVLFFCMQYYL